jgi:hypothetical protein
LSNLREDLHLKKFQYDTKKYPFYEYLSTLFGISDLEKIHEFLGHFDPFKREQDQNTILHKIFYSNFRSLNSPLQKMYEDFIRNFIAPIVSEKFYYQKIPTFRIGLPQNKFVGEFHQDTAYNHQPFEINFNLAIANYKGSAALITEDKAGSKKLIPAEINYGEVMGFDHIGCLHGSEINQTGKTMISMDFRLALADMYYEDLKAESVNMHSKFIIGDYFSSELINKPN